MLCIQKRKEGHTKWPDPNKIEVCSLCWLGEPVFELCQILLHPNLSLPVEGPGDSIGSDKGLSTVQRQAITWTNAAFLSIGPSGTNLSEIWIEIKHFSFMKMHLKLSSAKWQPFCPGELIVPWWGNNLSIIWVKTGSGCTNIYLNQYWFINYKIPNKTVGCISLEMLLSSTLKCI